MNRKKMIWLIYPAFLLVTIIALLATTFYASVAMKAFFLNHVSGNLAARANLIRSWVIDELTAGGDPAAMDARIKEMGGSSHTRITVMMPSGRVVADSEERPETMENHGDRPEMRTALTGRMGTATRYSRTLKMEMMYRAMPLVTGDGLVGVLRTSMPISVIDEKIGSIRWRIVLMGCLAALLAGGVAWFISRRVTGPLERLTDGAEAFARGALDHPIIVSETAELARLARSMKKMAVQLDEQIRTIKGQRNTYDAVLSSMTEGVVALDRQERVISINQAAAAMLDQEGAALADRRLYEVVRNNDLHQFVDHALAEPGVYQADLTLHVNGQRVLRLNSAPLSDADGMLMGILIVMTDVTQVRRLETVRRDFVTNISHEIKTPMTAILGYTETLKELLPEESPEVTRFFQAIDRNTRRLKQVVDDLITLSRIENLADSEQNGRSIAGLKNLIEDLVRDLEAAAGEKGVRVAVACPETVSVSVNLRFFRRALANLLENAIRHSPPASAVTIDCAVREDGIRIRIADQGPGIAPRHLPRIFERFYRTGENRTAEGGGSGLGLSIAKHIIINHGGEISAESVVGEGSVFTIRLPRIPSADDA